MTRDRQTPGYDSRERSFALKRIPQRANMELEAHVYSISKGVQIWDEIWGTSRSILMFMHGYVYIGHR